MFNRSLLFFVCSNFFLCSSLAFAATAPSFPVLAYSTYLRDNFTPTGIATDSSGNIYMAGSAVVDQATSQTTVLVVKLNPQASEYLYIRYIGGSARDTASAIAVDSAGNAYVVGVTISADFPVTNGSKLATPPVPGSTERSFVFKLDPNGQLVFSDLLGGSANSFAQAVAVTASGQVLVSGTSVQTGFPSTAGVYSVPDTSFRPYLLELDPSGAKVVFSATGIGGNSLAVDSSGNIYMAGTTSALDYPTTPGVYQPSFPVFQTCFAPCMGSFQGPNQYVTKLDPTGSKMIFSTAVSGTGNTLNEGLAVDSAGNVYLTGLAGAGYPFTVTPPTLPLAPALSTLTTPAAPFLSKLDPAGQKLLFSVPVGGLGVQVDSNGSVYAGGILGVLRTGAYDVAASLPALAGLPPQCLPNSTNITFTQDSAYAAQVDATSGNVLGAKFIGGTTLTISGVAFSGGKLWIAGTTSYADFPFSPNALTIQSLTPNVLAGAYLGAVDFTQPQPAPGTPQIACVVDSANLEQASPVAPSQLLTVLGTGLGPAQPATASGFSTTSLGGVSVSFGSLPATLLYASSNQINLAVPLAPEGPSGTAMQVMVNGVSAAPLTFPVTAAHPTLFLASPPTNPAFGGSELVVVALNTDGSLNSAANPAHLGSVVSVFVNGLTPDPLVASGPLVLYSGGGWSVTNFAQANPFVVQVSLRVPSSPANFACQANTSACVAGFQIFDINSYLVSNLGPGSTGGLTFGGELYVSQSQ